MAFASRLVGLRSTASGLNVLGPRFLSIAGLDRTCLKYHRQGSALVASRIAGLKTSSRHTYRHLANPDSPNAHIQKSTRPASSQPSSSTTATTNVAKPPSTAPVALNDAQKVSDREQRLTDWAIVRKLARNIWPSGPGSTEIKIRVVGALGLLVAGKVSSNLGFLGIASYLPLVDPQCPSSLFLQANRRCNERRNHGILYGLAASRIRHSRMYVSEGLYCAVCRLIPIDRRCRSNMLYSLLGTPKRNLRFRRATRDPSSRTNYVRASLVHGHGFPLDATDWRADACD